LANFKKAAEREREREREREKERRREGEKERRREGEKERRREGERETHFVKLHMRALVNIKYKCLSIHTIRN